jgi:hypothetical protein
LIDWARWLLGLPGHHLTDSPAFADYLQALDHVTEGQLLAMAAAFKAIDRAEHERSWGDVRAVGQRDGLDKEVERVRAKALAWTARGTNVAAMGGFRYMDDIGWASLKHEAAEPIVDAALAIALGDRLTPQTRATLLAGWEARDLAAAP